MSLSKTTIIGRLTRDPEVKQIGNDNVSVANFTVAVDRDFGEGADFYDVVAWRKLAENVGQYLGKGRLVYVEGRMQKRTYDAKLPGTETTYPRDVWEIQAEKCQFLDKGNNNAPANANQAAPSGYANQNQTQQPAYNNAPAPF
jgi:single-strand DNA-binding protein